MILSGLNSRAIVSHISLICSEVVICREFPTERPEPQERSPNLRYQLAVSLNLSQHRADSSGVSDGTRFSLGATGGN